MAKYQIKYNPATNLPIETRLYTLWKLEEFLGAEYDEDDWDRRVGERPNRRRSVILYSLRECWRNPSSNPLDQLEQTCRKYWGHTQPVYWPRFLREKFPMARIRDFFSVPYDDLRDEFYQYEEIALDTELNPDETGTVFNVRGAISKLKKQVTEIIDSMDMGKALTTKPRPAVRWNDAEPMTSNPEILAAHLQWLESHDVNPPLVKKDLPT